MPSDELDRDKLDSPNVDDEDELQLEPLDPEEVAAAQRRPAARIDASTESIDIEEIYRDLEGRRDAEIMTEWFQRLRNFNFQFRLKHLLALTAAVAILLAVNQWFGWATMFFLALMFTVIGITLYLNREEQKRQVELARRREQVYAERRARMRRDGQPSVEEAAVQPALPEPLEVARPPAAVAREFRFQFSLAQYFVAITAAILLLGLIQLLGGVLSATTILGLIALAGLAIHAAGYQPPEIVAFGWWLLLALYVVLSLFSAFWAVIVGE